MAASDITRGQLERNLSQKLQAFYHEKLGRRPERITCQFFDEKLAIVLEKVTIPSERLLLESKHPDFAYELRNQLDMQMKPLLQVLLEEILGTGVVTMLINTDLKKDVSGIIAVLSDIPSIRDPESIPKVKKEKVVNSNNE
ncbi:hypothetical protein NIES4071_54680 [Calothrix sp. NIES-4071]|nr:hypothetical protein NIES4071_54680 [Calothrix sp. NIES-4071]BAZ59776.1 hypothetical protein NIES4105_54630 [Calothrix sp. NIES-4105]